MSRSAATASRPRTSVARTLAAAVAVQADGKFVVAGTSDGNFVLARYGADGALDPSFSGDGLVTTDLGGTDDGQGVAIQTDGKIVVAGGSGGNFALARYTTGGGLDPSFSGDGWADDRLRPRRRRYRGGDPGRRPDRRRGELGRRFRAGALRRQRGDSTRPSAATVSRPPTSVGRIPAMTWRSPPTARSSSWAPTRASMAVRRTSRWPATPRAGRWLSGVDDRLRLEPVDL